MAAFIITCLLGYLAGSIPFGLVLTRLAGIPDIRKIGSGNIGATNVLRTGRKDLALLTVIFDASKAGLVALLFVIMIAMGNKNSASEQNVKQVAKELIHNNNKGLDKSITNL